TLGAVGPRRRLHSCVPSKRRSIPRASSIPGASLRLMHELSGRIPFDAHPGGISRIFAVADEFWTATFWSFVGQAGFGAPLMASATPRKQLGDLIRSGARGPVDQESDPESCFGDPCCH